MASFWNEEGKAYLNVNKEDVGVTYTKGLIIKIVLGDTETKGIITDFEPVEGIPGSMWVELTKYEEEG